MSGPVRRILVAHPFPDLYGSDRALLNALRALGDRGYQVTVVVPEPGPLLAVLAQEGVPVDVVPFPVLRRAVLRPAQLARFVLSAPWHTARLVRLVRRRSPDVVYVNTLTLPHWLVACRLARVPMLCHVREAQEQLARNTARVLTAPLRLAPCVVANSDATRRWIVAHAPSVADRVRVVRNGYRFPTAPAPRVRSGAARLLVVGRLNPLKGQDTAIDAAALLVGEGRDVELEIVGGVFRGYEAYADTLRSRAEQLGVGERVRLTGFLADPTAAYERADVVLMPSIVESFGNVAVEAQSLTRPVVATSVGGLREIVVDGESGLLVPPRDPRAVADAVAKLLDDPALAERLAVAGARRVREEFGFERMTRGLEEAIATVI